MKQSLWDLKLTDGIQLLANYGSWSSPYGIWNSFCLPFCLLNMDHEAVPMGFETPSQTAAGYLPQIMKQSLWDLKPPDRLMKKREKYDHEAVPMGFETAVAVVLPADYVDHEAVPMGFETHWRHPASGQLRDHEAVPMGFETPCR